MRGGIHKKGNNYYAVVYDGIDPGTGHKRRRWVPAGTRRADAERVLADLIRRKYEGEPVPTERLDDAADGSEPGHARPHDHQRKRSAGRSQQAHAHEQHCCGDDGRSCDEEALAHDGIITVIRPGDQGRMT